MADKKKQHYVPRFYLKYFSIFGNGDAIGVYNIKSKKYIPVGSVNNQAYSNYFYGDDLVLENVLCDLEGQASVVISNIINYRGLPAHAEDYLILLMFVIFQANRTKYQAEELNEMIDKQFHVIFKDDHEFKEKFAPHKIEFTNPMQFGLKIVAEILPITFDLDCMLIINNSKVPFITSDNPVVIYNQFLEGRKTYGGIGGLGQKGLQLFLPISPKMLLLFYDGRIYHMGSSKKSCVLQITDTKDIYYLNLLQAVNANENIYFNHHCEKSYLDNLVVRGEVFFRKEKSNVLEYVSSNRKERSSILHLYREDIRISLELSFIRESKEAKRYNLDDKMVHVRNPEIIKQVEEEHMERMKNEKNKKPPE